jgi:hypothetical protein
MGLYESVIVACFDEDVDGIPGRRESGLKYIVKVTYTYLEEKM